MSEHVWVVVEKVLDEDEEVFCEKILRAFKDEMEAQAHSAILSLWRTNDQLRGFPDYDGLNIMYEVVKVQVYSTAVEALYITGLT